MTTNTNNTMTSKDIRVATAAIGSSLDAAAKLAAVTAVKETASPLLKAVLNDYAHAMRTTTSEKTALAAGASPDDATAFSFSAACLFRAAVSAADVAHKEADAKKLNNALFTEWKGFLSMLAGDTVKAAASDREFLLAAATRKAKEGISYKARTNAAGEVVASVDVGVTHTAAASFSAFLKEAERLAVERIMGFDGVVSLATGKAISENNSALKEAALTLYTDGVELEKKAS